MIGVFIKRQNLDKHTERVTDVKMQGIWRLPPTSQGERPETSSFLIALRNKQLYRNLDFQLVASRAVRQEISVVWTIWSVALCYGNPSKLKQSQIVYHQTVIFLAFMFLFFNCANMLKSGRFTWKKYEFLLFMKDWKTYSSGLLFSCYINHLRLSSNFLL